MWQTCWKWGEGIKQIILKQGMHSKLKTFLSLDCVFGLVEIKSVGQN